MDNEFMNFMGYRYMVIEDKIRECMSAAKRGETQIDIERGDLTDAEIEYLRREVQRRIESGKY